MKNKILLISLILTLLLSNTSYASSTNNLVINGKILNIDVEQEFNGDYFLPLKDVVTEFGGGVSYDPLNSIIDFNFEDKFFSYSVENKTLNYKINNLEESFSKPFDIRLKDGKSYISLGFLTNYFGTSFEKLNRNLFLSSNGNLSNNIIIKPLLVTHGGGDIHNTPITNSLEAISNSINSGSKLIELDFLKTSDDKYVLGHDWGSANKHFGKNSGKKTYEEYIMKNSDFFTPLGMDDLIEILDDYQNLSIVTDTTDDNQEFLNYIFSNYNSYMNRFKVQVYSIDEYYFAKSLGFKDIIYSMYQVYLTDGQIFSFARDNEVYAITMGESRALSGLAKRLTDINVMTYVHTVNDIDLINKYRNLGVVGFYTDKLY